MQRVLVTGATGFIGRHTLPFLSERGFEVHAVSSRIAAFPEGIQGHVANLLVESQTTELLAGVRPTHLLHLAWYTEAGAFWSSPLNFQWLKASLTLIEAFSASGGQRAVLAGTCAEYDAEGGTCSEDETRLLPSTLYGSSKHALHVAASAYARQCGLSVSWARVFQPYGPHEQRRRLIPSVACALLSGEPTLCTAGEQVQDFLFVEDVASALVALLASDVAGAVNIGSGQGTAVKDVVGMIAEILGREELVRLGALPAAPGPGRLVAAIGRLGNEVGWSPTCSLAEGLLKTVEWWRANTCAIH